MRINIKMKDCQFVVNKGKRKVVCIIRNTSRMFYDFLNEEQKNFYVLGQDFIDKLEMPNQFIGIATCSSDDEWNEETGKLLAYQRAKYKFNVAFFKRANIFVNALDGIANRAQSRFNSYGEKVTANMTKCEKKLNTMFNKEEET